MVSVRHSKVAEGAGNFANGRLSRTLTLISIALPVLVLASLLCLYLFGGTVLDWLTPIFFWVWLWATPFVAGAGLLASRREARTGQAVLNGASFAAWTLGLLAAVLLH